LKSAASTDFATSAFAQISFSAYPPAGDSLALAEALLRVAAERLD
jgi:hypothetical protein